MQVLLDVGAGSGYFSMAAAARGHRVIAFELSPRSLLSFEASIAYNGFQDRIVLHKARSLRASDCAEHCFGVTWGKVLLPHVVEEQVGCPCCVLKCPNGDFRVRAALQ